MQRGFRHGLPGGGLDAGRELGDPIGELLHLGARAAGRYEPRTVNSGVCWWMAAYLGGWLDCCPEGGVVVVGEWVNRHAFIITYCFKRALTAPGAPLRARDDDSGARVGQWPPAAQRDGLRRIPEAGPDRRPPASKKLSSKKRISAKKFVVSAHNVPAGMRCWPGTGRQSAKPDPAYSSRSMTTRWATSQAGSHFGTFGHRRSKTLRL